MSVELPHSKYQLGLWAIDCELLTLSRDNEQATLPAKTFEVLKFLFKNAEKTVSKEDIIEAVWDGNVDVGSRGVVNAIWQIRKALGREGEPEDAYIKTIPRLGYQLVCIPDPILPSTSPVRHARATPFHLAGMSLVVISLLLVFIWTLVSTAPKTQHAFNKTQLTNFEGVEDGADISPDGNLMAFHWADYKNDFQIYIKDLNDADAELRLFSTGKEAEQYPKWSPDGQRLAYFSIDEHDVCQVMLKTLTGKAQVIGRHCLPASEYQTPLAWSDQGDALIYSKKMGQGAALVSIDVSSLEQSQLTFPSGSTADKQVINVGENAWVFSRAQGMRSNLWLISTNGKISQLTNNDQPIESLTWHLQTQRVYFVSLIDGRNQLFAISLQGELEKIPLDMRVSGVSSNPASGDLIVSSYIAQEHIIELDPERKQTVSKFSSSYRDMYGSYSPSMNGVIFSSNRSGQWETWLSANRKSRQLTDNVGFVALPSANPVNNLFVVPIRPKDEKFFTLFLGDLESGELQKLSTPAADSQFATWSKDGKSIYFSSIISGQWKVYQYDLTTQEYAVVTKEDGKYAIEESPDTLLLTRDNQNGLWRYHKNTHTYEMVTDKLSFKGWGNFTATEKGIYFVMKQQEGDKIILLLPDGSEQEVISFPKGTIRNNRSLAKASGSNLLVGLIGPLESNIYVLSRQRH